MSGILGGGSAKTDRGNQLAATQADWNIFGYGLPTGEAMQTAGTNTLQSSLSTLTAPENYYKSLLTAGRTDTASRAAPAIQAQTAQEDARRREQASTGTNRSGGAAAVNAEAGVASEGNIDNIINSTLQTGRTEGAQGLTKIAGAKAAIGNIQLTNALQQLGLSSNAVNNILSNATESRGQSFEMQSQEGAAIGSLILAGLAL